MNINNKIKEIRRERGITQAELAKQIGIARNTLSYWENGKSDVDTANLKKIAAYFQVSTDFLLCQEEVITPDTNNALTEYIEQLKKTPRTEKVIFSHQRCIQGRNR